MIKDCFCRARKGTLVSDYAVKFTLQLGGKTSTYTF